MRRGQTKGDQRLSRSGYRTNWPWDKEKKKGMFN